MERRARFEWLLYTQSLIKDGKSSAGGSYIVNSLYNKSKLMLQLESLEFTSLLATISMLTIRFINSYYNTFSSMFENNMQITKSYEDPFSPFSFPSSSSAMAEGTFNASNSSLQFTK